MTWPLLQLLVAIYGLGVWWLRRQRWRLIFYMWASFGLAFLLIHLSLLQGWNVAISALEASQAQQLLIPLKITARLIDATTLLIPDPTGWSGLNIGIECSTLLELSVFWGLMLYYPRLGLRKRWLYLAIGTAATYGLNMLRILIIV